VSNKTIVFRQIVLKNVETYVLSNFISNFKEYKVGEDVTINHVSGRVVGYGFRVYRIEVAE
jgi:hypothetical protein